MHRPLTIAFFLTLITFAHLSTTAQSLINYKGHPIVQITLKDGSIKCGYYDECNDFLFDCMGNMAVLNPITISQKVASNDCCANDSDKDGTNDEVDKCPDIFGYARYRGCPIPDTDKDGVNDEEDKCINEPGPSSNFGCPELTGCSFGCRLRPAAYHIYLDPGSRKISPISQRYFANAIQILKENPQFNLTVEGHTDSIGNYDSNMKLSEARAALVAKLLTAAGIDKSRISTEGFGPDKPVATNKTAAGRARNRRVDLKLRNY